MKSNLFYIVFFILVVVLLFLTSICFDLDISSKVRYSGLILCIGLIIALSARKLLNKKRK